MDVWIAIETTFENGEKRTHQLDGVSRPYRVTRPDGIGLRLEDGKRVVEQIQRVSRSPQCGRRKSTESMGSGQNMGVLFGTQVCGKVASLRRGLPWTYGLQSKRPLIMVRSVLISLTAFHDRTRRPAQKDRAAPRGREEGCRAHTTGNSLRSG